MHRYCHRELQQNDNIDISVSQQRSCAKQITSQLKAYLGAIQGQEIPTQFLVHKRQSLANHQQQIINVAYAK